MTAAVLLIVAGAGLMAYALAGLGMGARDLFTTGIRRK